jgi:hypothetical protein
VAEADADGSSAARLSAASIGVDFVPDRAPTVYTVEIDGEAVLLDEEANRLHHLNHTAALLWACFDGHAPVRELAQEVSEELGLEYDEVLTDTLAVVRDLGAEGLLAGIRPDPDDGEGAAT